MDAGAWAHGHTCPASGPGRHTPILPTWQVVLPAGPSRHCHRYAGSVGQRGGGEPWGMVVHVGVASSEHAANLIRCVIMRVMTLRRHVSVACVPIRMPPPLVILCMLISSAGPGSAPVHNELGSAPPVWVAAGTVLPAQPYEGAVSRMGSISDPAPGTPTTQDIAEAPLRLVVALPGPGSQPSVAAQVAGGSSSGQVVAAGSLYLDDGGTLAVGAAGESVVANITVTTAVLPGKTSGSYVLDYVIVNGPAPGTQQPQQAARVSNDWVIPTITEVVVLGVPAPLHPVNHPAALHRQSMPSSMAADCPPSGFTAVLNGAPLPDSSTEYNTTSQALSISLATRSEPSHPGGGASAGEDMRLEWSACGPTIRRPGSSY